MQKIWSNPIVQELSIKETTAGACRPQFHDGNIYESVDENGNIVAVEEYWQDS